MNKYLMIRRLRWPLLLLLVGVMALLSQAGILRWHQSWPLFLVYFGVFMLAERAALSMDGYPGYSGPCAPTSTDTTTETGTVETHDASESTSTHADDAANTTRGVQL
jgi:hypothetical protein